jgi:hypothetical protein
MIGEPRGQRSGAAADVEHAATTKVARVNEQLVDLRPPFGLGIAKLVVARGELAELDGVTAR